MTSARVNKLFSKIAAEKLFIDTLETRGRDHLDFHDVSVASIRAALLAAYEAGRRDGLADQSERSAKRAKSSA